MGSSPTRLRVLITTPSPTKLFRAELLTATYATRFESGCLVPSLSVIVRTLCSYSGSVNGWIVSISSIATSLSFSAT